MDAHGSLRTKFIDLERLGLTSQLELEIIPATRHRAP